MRGVSTVQIPSLSPLWSCLRVLPMAGVLPCTESSGAPCQALCPCRHIPISEQVCPLKHPSARCGATGNLRKRRISEGQALSGCFAENLPRSSVVIHILAVFSEAEFLRGEVVPL